MSLVIPVLQMTQPKIKYATKVTTFIQTFVVIVVKRENQGRIPSRKSRLVGLNMDFKSQKNK